jgi:tetratricopeptide (TPR) repeat protein
MALGKALTGDSRERIITIHGGGGQGKTVLAREVVERFAWAWPGGVWATILENLPGRDVFVTALARFLGIITKLEGPSTDPDKLETQVLAQLAERRVLIVLDNAETLVDAVEAQHGPAIQLAGFIRQLPGSSVSLLVTSRIQLGWPGEVSFELGGLSPEEGAMLFRQSAPQRADAIDMHLAQQLAQKIEGHPFSLRLLGGAFNASALALPAFLEEHQEQLVKAENKYVGPDHRHRTLYANIDTSVRYLDAELRALLSKLWVFHAPFLPEIAVAIVDPQAENTQKHSSVYEQLHTLWQRGLLTRETATTRDGTLLFYHLLPVMRPYVERYLAQKGEHETILVRFGEEYAQLVRFIGDELNRGGVAASLALLFREDLERGATCVTGVEQGYYLLYWGGILQRLGDSRHGLELTEQALDIAQIQQDNNLYLRVLNSMALMYQAIGQPQRALELYEQALPLVRAVGDRDGEAAILTGLALVYQTIGQPQRALQLNEQALPLARAVGDWAGEASTFHNMARVYDGIGQPQRALELYEQALSIRQDVGDRAGEASTLDNMGAVYQTIGQPQRALELYEQALPIRQDVGDRAGEASTLDNMAVVYNEIGQPQRALELFEQALPIWRDVGVRDGEANTLQNMAGVYRAIGQPERALELFEQALPIRCDVGDRAGEANTLNGLALVYDDIGQPQRALQLNEQALSIRRDVGDRAGEATTLHNMAGVYDGIGQPQRALELYEQALPLARAVGDRAGEADTLNNMAVVYDGIGQPQRALELYEQALPIRRDVGDRDGEANTLNNMAVVYDDIGQPQRTLELYEQALLIKCDVGDRAGEATILNNMAEMYSITGKPQEALKLYEQALPIHREVGDWAMEATTLNNMAEVYSTNGKPQEALKLYEQALPIAQEVGDRAGEAAILTNKAWVLYQSPNHSEDALPYMEQAITVLVTTGLLQDAVGRTVEDLRRFLQSMRAGTSPSSLTGDPST